MLILHYFRLTSVRYVLISHYKGSPDGKNIIIKCRKEKRANCNALVRAGGRQRTPVVYGIDE